MGLENADQRVQQVRGGDGGAASNVRDSQGEGGLEVERFWRREVELQDLSLAINEESSFETQAFTPIQSAGRSDSKSSSRE